MLIVYNSIMKSRKPLEPITKVKLLIQGEYLVIAILFLVFGILKICGIMNSSPLRAHIFNFVTLAGSLWIIADFIWCTVSKKRKEKVTYLDKVINLPLGIYLLIYNIISLVIWDNVAEWYRYGISFVFFYIFLSYSFQAVYHWFYPTKALLNAVSEVEEEEDKEETKVEEASKEIVNEDKVIGKIDEVDDNKKEK